MLETTKNAIRAICATDPSVTPDMLAVGIAAMSGETAATLTDPEPLDESLSREQCAKLLGVSPRTISIYATRGLITPFRYGAKGERARGYSRRSIKELQQRSRR